VLQLSERSDSMAVIDCHEIRGQILTEAKKQIEELVTKPKLTIISIGEDFASKIYIKNKINFCVNIADIIKKWYNKWERYAFFGYHY
jgi:5,10-methylene-tetrahydrofolate dehydrogenase/methenyl tetrahydrofolate cyclohydrolase